MTLLLILLHQPDGSLLATGCDDGVARIWTCVIGILSTAFANLLIILLRSDGEIYVVLTSHTSTVFVVRWNATGNLLLTGSLDHTVCLWETESGKSRHQWNTHSGDSLLGTLSAQFYLRTLVWVQRFRTGRSMV